MSSPKPLEEYSRVLRVERFTSSLHVVDESMLRHVGVILLGYARISDTYIHPLSTDDGGAGLQIEAKYGDLEDKKGDSLVTGDTFESKKVALKLEDGSEIPTDLVTIGEYLFDNLEIL